MDEMLMMSLELLRLLAYTVIFLCVVSWAITRYIDFWTAVCWSGLMGSQLVLWNLFALTPVTWHPTLTLYTQWIMTFWALLTALRTLYISQRMFRLIGRRMYASLVDALTHGRSHETSP